MGTILTALVLLCVITAITVKIIRDKSRGKCAGCPCCRDCDSKNWLADAGQEE